MDDTSPITLDEIARGRLFRVAAVLLAAAILGTVFNLFGLIFVWGLSLEATVNARPAPSPWMATAYLTSGAWCLGLIGCAVVLSRTRSYPLAIAMCCLAMVPFVGPFLVLGVPIGLWGLIVLWSPQVREAFRAPAVASRPPTSARQQRGRSRLFLIGMLLAASALLGLAADGVGVFLLMARALKLAGPELRFQLWWCLCLGIHSLYALVLLAGGLTLARGRARLFSTATACLACVPILSPCYALSIPFGVWALLTLRDPDAIAAFAPALPDVG